jgi:hypothetical protein
VLNPAGTVVSTRSVDRNHVLKIEQDAPDRTLWETVKRARLAPHSYAPAYYDKVIELCFDAFLAAHPESAYRADAEALRAQWVAERTKVTNGYAKVDDRWYEPGQAVPRRLPDATRRRLATFKRFFEQGDSERALEVAATVRIPTDFAAERAVFHHLLSGTLDECERSVSGARRALELRREEALRVYEQERNNIPRHRDGKFPLADVRFHDAAAAREWYEEERARKRREINWQQAAIRRRDRELEAVEAKEKELEERVSHLSALARRAISGVTDRTTRDHFRDAAPSLLGKAPVRRRR